MTTSRVTDPEPSVEPTSRTGVSRETASTNGSPRDARDADETAAGPLITCVIPTYNGMRFLKEAIDSVLDQDYPNIECIVVDADSTDGTVELLKSFGDKITWVSRKDRGAFDAINDGWKMGKGEILAWVNSDDRWEPGAARLAARYFSNHPEVDVLYGTCGGIDPDGHLLVDLPPRPWDLRFALQNCDHIINQTASFMRRSIIEEIGYLYPAWCHDHDLWLRIAIAGGTFNTTTRRLGSARIWPNNLGNNPNVIIPGKVGLTQRIFKNPRMPESLRDLREEAISNSYLRCLFYISPTKPKNWPLAARLFSSAVLAHPTNIFYLSSQVVAVVAQKMPGAGLLRRGYYGLRRLIRGVSWLARTTASLAIQTYRALWRLLRAVMPAAAVAVAAGIVVGYGLEGIEAAQTFLFVAVPLLVMAYLYDQRSRG